MGGWMVPGSLPECAYLSIELPNYLTCLADRRTIEPSPAKGWSAFGGNRIPLGNTIITQFTGILLPGIGLKRSQSGYCSNLIIQALDKPKRSVLILKRKAT